MILESFAQISEKTKISVQSEWNQMSEAYESFHNSPDSYSYLIEWPCIQKLLPDLHGRSVLDFGCGTGIFTFLLETYGTSKIVGIDLSEEMLKIAIAKGEKNKSTTTHYLEDLDKLFENIRNVLKDEGTCILSVIHPIYSAMYPIEHGDTFPDDDEIQEIQEPMPPEKWKETAYERYDNYVETPTYLILNLSK